MEVKMQPIPTRLLACAVVFLAQMHARGDDATAIHPASDRLSDVQRIVRPAIEHNKLSFLHMRPVGMLALFNRSRWRNSIEDVIRLLVTSSAADERRVGWQLAQERVYSMGWTKADIDKILAEPVEEVKIAAISSVAVTDVAWISECIERVLNDPTATTRCRQECVRQLNKVPTLSHRVRLWLVAAKEDTLRADCVLSFRSVSSSESAILVIASYLGDTSIVHVAVSNHSGQPFQLRTLACQALGTMEMHKERAIVELQKRCSMPPDENHLEFLIAAMIASHTLNPESPEPVEQIMKWYTELPKARATILQSLVGQFTNSDKFESLVISKSQEMPPDQKYCVCQWLSSRRSREATATLKILLRDPHAGTRVAAAVALTKADPLFDLSTMREDLLAAALSSPNEFTAAFSSLSDTVSQLALAGQSDDAAIEWLKQKRKPEFQLLCDKALEVISVDITGGWSRYIPWNEAGRVQR
jgi:hypothetical protein